MLKLGKVVENSLVEMRMLNRVFREGISENFMLGYES